MTKSTFEVEKSLLERKFQLIIGIDEAGRGPLAGPVVAAATAVRNFQLPIFNFQTSSNNLISNDRNLIKNFDLIRDSKTLSEKQREKLFDFIQEHFFVGVGMCDHETIDRMNILEASFLAMKKAVAALLRNMEHGTQNMEQKLILLIDGNKKIPNLSVEQRAIVNGDKIVKSISAASIIAKVTRDRMMKQMHKEYPVYGFDKHKGYGTAFHIQALMKNGCCKIHRKSFEPVKTLVKKGR